MKQVAKKWKIAAALFAAVNIGGAIYAVWLGEWGHAMVHAALVAGGYVAWQIFTAGRSAVDRTLSEPADLQRIDSLQNAVDSIALDVERVGEAQRYHEKMLRDRAGSAKT